MVIESLSLRQFAKHSQGQLIGEDLFFQKVSLDSRACNDALFFAIKGEQHDGHDYINGAIENGCLAVVTERALSGVSVPWVQVDSTVNALGSAAELNRVRFSGELIALTGSSGKTTTKNMLAAILGTKAQTCATQGNQNNELGVPLTLLALGPEHRFGVIEMGARHAGDIAYLCRVAQPDIALVLNAGSAHLGEFGSYQAIVETKGEMYRDAPQKATLVMNLDDPAHATWLQMAGNRTVVTYSQVKRSADLFAERIDENASGSEIVLHYAGDAFQITVPLAGRHNVSNALAAIAVALHAGLSVEEIRHGLAGMQASSGRMLRIELSNGAQLIDDSYNANPQSMAAALEVLALHQGRKIAVLGEMAELGQSALNAHLEVAKKAKSLSLDGLFLVGSFAEQMAATFGPGAYAFTSKEALLNKLKQELTKDLTVLIKGSRSAGMDSVVNSLSGEFS